MKKRKRKKMKKKKRGREKVERAGGRRIMMMKMTVVGHQPRQSPAQWQYEWLAGGEVRRGSRISLMRMIFMVALTPLPR